MDKVESTDDGSLVTRELKQETEMTYSAGPPKATGKTEADKPRPPARQPAKPGKGEDFGEEGTNKTRAAPKPDGAAPEGSGIIPHIEKSPYTRG